MAARKIRPRPAAEAPVESASATPPDASPPEPRRRSTFGIALALFVLWFAALAGLAIWTANPVTLNHEQLRAADIVVEATVTDKQTGACLLVQSWPAGAAGETITVSGLSQLPVTAGETYLLALSRSARGGSYAVVATPPPEAAQLVYPATEGARRQVAEILDTEPR